MFPEEEIIERTEWLANSCNVNPIEHMWDQLNRSVYSRIDDDTDLTGLGIRSASLGGMGSNATTKHPIIDVRRQSPPD